MAAGARAGLPLRVPRAAGLGRPSSAFPFTWAIYRWIDGQPYSDEVVPDERRAAADLANFVTAWSVFGRSGRAAYRDALGVDDQTWQRARGYALHQAALIIPYYAQSNPGFAGQAKRTVAEVLADLDEGG